MQFGTVAGRRRNLRTSSVGLGLKTGKNPCLISWLDVHLLQLGLKKQGCKKFLSLIFTFSGSFLSRFLAKNAGEGGGGQD